MIKILHLDDHTLFAEGLASLLTAHGIKTYSAYSANQAIVLAEQHQDLDIVITDLALPGLDGLSFIQSLEQRDLMLPIAVLSASNDIWEIKAAIDSGAAGFIPKTFSTQQILNAIKEILNGKLYLPPLLQESIAQLPNKEPNNSTEKKIAALKLSQRQLDVLHLMQKGCSNDEIAIILFISKNTVKTHIKNLFATFKASNRIECIRCAENAKII